MTGIANARLLMSPAWQRLHLSVMSLSSVSSVFRGLRLLRRIERDDVVDVLIAEIGDQARHQDVLARGAVGLDRLRQILRILGGEAWRCRIGTHAVRAMTSAAHGGLRLAGCRIAVRRRAALRRRLRGEIQRQRFQYRACSVCAASDPSAPTARCAGQIFLRRRDEIDAAAGRRDWACRRSCCCRPRRDRARRPPPPPCRSRKERRRVPFAAGIGRRLA